MSSLRTIRSIRVQNLLSYGPDAIEIELQPLNVLIGANASGKSNLIEAIGLLQAASTDLAAGLRAGGGIGEWLWKGQRNTNTIATIDATLYNGLPDARMSLRYRLEFTQVGQRIELLDETIENERSQPGHALPYFYYKYQRGQPVINIQHTNGTSGKVVEPPVRQIRRDDLLPDQSILSQRRDPDLYPEITYLGRRFAEFHLYREWNLGRSTAPRLPQQADLPADVLMEDASNLALVLNNLQHHADYKQRLIRHLQLFYGNITDVTTRIAGGTVQLFFHEQGLTSPIPATRLSDGTLRFLCLLAVLLHPTPPPLICIEEPELGLHPDIIPTLAELLIEASQRTQLIITTHSDALVSALGHMPNSVLVCDRDAGGSRIRRLDPQQLAAWLETYTLGDLWRMGELGGTRW